MMIPIPSSGQGPFLPPAPSTPPLPAPVFHFEPQHFKSIPPVPSIPSPPDFRFESIELKLQALRSSIQSQSLPFSPPALKSIDFTPEWRTSFEPNKPPIASPLEQKVTAVFLLAFVWIYTAFTIAGIARDKGFAKKCEISMALIGATTVTILTYTHPLIGVSSLVIFVLIHILGCNHDASSASYRDFYNQHSHLLRFDPPARPIQFNAQLLPPHANVPFLPVQPAIQPWNHIPFIHPRAPNEAGG